ncbi:MAG: putative minor capsid protein [Huintestinicola sp.]
MTGCITPPIPLELLPHKCRLKLYGAADSFGNRVLISDTELSNVRISLYRKKTAGLNGDSGITGGTLYYDCVNSSPENAELSVTDGKTVIEYNGQSFEILRTKYIYGDSSLHHIEIELGGVCP